MVDTTTRSGPKVLLAGGGSGGHVFPALAVGEAVRERGGTVDFVGAPDRMEARLVPARGIPFHALPARPLVGRGLGSQLAALWTLAGSTFRAHGLARRLRPDAVLATGGYVSVAPALGARLAGVPLLLLEPNAAPGAANRRLARIARGACVAFPETGEALRCPTWITGIPVREAFFAVPSELLPAPPWRLLLVGGSQGSQELNRLLPEALASAAPGLGPLEVLHQAGEGHVTATEERYRASVPRSVSVTVLPFLDDPAAALAGSHLVIARAGAITLAELCAAGRAAILVPLTLAAGHQEENAAVLARAGAARVLPAGSRRSEALAELLQHLLADPGTLREMAGSARLLARPDAADAIARRLEEIAS